MITLPWGALVALAFAVALAAALVVLIVQATREIRTESVWDDVEGVAAAMVLGIEQQRPAVEEEVARLEQIAARLDVPVEIMHLSAAEALRRRERDAAFQAGLAAHADALSIQLTAEYLAEHPINRVPGSVIRRPETTPIHDRLVAEQKAEEQAGIRRRVEELGIDWTVSG